MKYHNKHRRYLTIGTKRIAFIFFAVVFIITLTSACGTLSSKMLNIALKPQYTSRDTTSAWKYEILNHPEVGTWRNSLYRIKALRDTFITDQNGIKLHALYAKSPNPTNKTAIIVHGHTSSSIGVAHIGRMYNTDLNTNIILPDLKLSGLSGGDHYTMGWFERYDIHRWIEVAENLFGQNTNIIIHGISMGAATVMMLSGDNLSNNVKCLIEDCGYTTVFEEFKHVLKTNYHIRSTSLIKSANKKSKKLYGFDFTEASSLAQIKKSNLPMLFIHGDADNYVPTYMVYQLYNAKPSPKDIWIVPGATHASSYEKAPQEYSKRVKDFVNKYVH